MTKVTTTRSVRQMPSSGPDGDDFYFDAADGNALPIVDRSFINSQHNSRESTQYEQKILFPFFSIDSAYGVVANDDENAELYSLEYKLLDRTSINPPPPPGASYSGGYISQYGNRHFVSVDKLPENHNSFCSYTG